MLPAEGPIDSDRGHDRWWEHTWPLERGDWLRLAGWLAIVIVVGVAAGEILTNWSALAALIELDDDIARNLADSRTSTGEQLAHWSAFIADTPVKIALSIVIAGWLAWHFERWHEAVMVGLPLVFEATAFIITTFVVGRHRPDVERLLDSPVDSSFPSGHVAAATVYCALAVVVFWHTRAIWARTSAVVLATAAPVMVGWARMYQGMHFFTDVVAGILLGLASVVIVRRILGPPPDAIGHNPTGPVPFGSAGHRAERNGRADEVER